MKEKSIQTKLGNHRGRSLWVITTLLAVVWFALFTGGVIIDTTPHRASLLEFTTLGGWEIVQSIGMVILFYTPANLAFLCVLAGMLGAVGDQIHLVPGSGHSGTRDQSVVLLSAIVRGFAVYVVLISGVLLITFDPISAPTQAGYVRLAGLVSGFSFVMSYNPAIFARVLQRVAGGRTE